MAKIGIIPIVPVPSRSVLITVDEVGWSSLIIKNICKLFHVGGSLH